ncbi:MAG: 3-deoxy-7-phosphoheptulonate synthase [bacterium]
MLVVLARTATAADIDRLLEAIAARGGRGVPQRLNGSGQSYVLVTGLPPATGPSGLAALPGVEQVLPVTRPYLHASRTLHADATVVDLGGIPVGGPSLTIVAGPCAVESREQTFEVADAVAAAGAHGLRGGAYKPRTSPYSFQGLGQEGLEILAEARARTGLRIVTEAMDAHQLEAVAQVADAIQIGARNMQNFSLLRAAGEQRLPILLKRGMSATLTDWLLAAEYILDAGNPQVILCERGIRTFTDHARNTLDLSVIPAAKQETHLPILVDPSHATGKRSLVAPMARAAIAAGADGLLIEVHAHPHEAQSDGEQAILPHEFAQLMTEIEALAPILGRSLAGAVVSLEP